MNDHPNPEEQAKARFFLMNMIRLLGAIMVILGMLVTGGTLAWPKVVGYALLVFGLIDFFVVPLVLARKWRSPDR